MNVEKPIKVLHIAPFDVHVLLILNHLRRLQDDGFEVHIACNEGSLVPSFRSEGLNTHRLEISRKPAPLSDLWLLKNLFQLIRRERFTIVHTHTPKIELVGQLAAKLAKVPVVIYTNHGLFFRREMSFLGRSLVINTARVASLFSDHVLSQSKADIVTALQERLYRKDQISYLGNGVNLDHYNVGRFSAHAVKTQKSKLGIPSESRVVGIVGRYVNEKGYREFFEAAAQISKQHPDVFFLAIGSAVPNERDPVNPNLPRQLGISHRVIRLTSRLDMPELYSVMNVLVLPSYREGFPRSLIEGAAMSRPVVATNIAGCREAVVDGYNGFLVPMKRVEPLTEKITLLLENPGLCNEMGRHGRELAEREFDENDVIARLKNCYQQNLSSSQVPAVKKIASPYAERVEP